MKTSKETIPAILPKPSTIIHLPESEYTTGYQENKKIVALAAMSITVDEIMQLFQSEVITRKQTFDMIFKGIRPDEFSRRYD